MDILIIFSFFGCGILLGRLLLSNRPNRFLPRITMFIIWLLLFCLGLEVGCNKEVVNGLSTMGLTALIITAGSLAGSMFFSWLLWKSTLKDSKKSK